MTVEEAKCKLAFFKSSDKHRARLSEVHLNGKFAYVSDGRIALRASIDHEVDKDSDEFPFNFIDEFVKCVDGASQWMSIDSEKFMNVGEMFLKAFKDHEVEQRSEIRRRYKHCYCPCCGKDIYWDYNCGKLVELEDVEEVDSNPANVDFPVRLNLQEGTYLDVAFGYLYLIRKAFGTDILFSNEMVIEGSFSRLFVKTSDGSVKGVLMPLRAAEDDFVPEHIIDTHAHECCVK